MMFPATGPIHVTRAAAGALTTALLLAAALSAPASATFEGTVALPVPAGWEPSEPHVAINPRDANNIVVVSHLSPRPTEFEPGQVPPLVNKLAYWATADGGASWTPGTFLGKTFEGRRAVGSDPVVAFGTDGTAYYAGMALPYKGRSWQSLVIVGRSTDAGRTFGQEAVIVRTKNRGSLLEEASEGFFSGVLNDKEWIATDQTAGPFAGTVYAAWDKIARRGQDLLFSRMPAGTSSFTPPVRISRKSVLSQIVVRPNGTVDLLWLNIAGDEAAVRRGKLGSAKITHAASSDGGTSFSLPQTVAKIDDGRVDVPTLATNASGKLLACWPQILRKDIDLRRDKLRSATVTCSNSADGLTWSSPASIDPSEPGVKIQSLPVAAAQGERFWVTTYAASKHKTRVLLFRSDDGGATFTRDRAFATRNYGPEIDKFFGDYTGLAATTNKLVAAYALSQRGRARSGTELLFTSIATS